MVPEYIMVPKAKPKCPHCESKEIVKRGYFETQAHGKQQRYFCKSCKKKFLERTAFYRMRNHEKKITLCMDLYYRGVSLRKIQEHLQMFYSKNSSHMSIYRWLIRYSTYISKLTDNIQIQSGQELMSDEMEYHRLGEQNWFVDVMDTKTRYMVASDYMKSRTIDNLTNVLKRGKFATKEQIKIITTDGLQGYPRVLKKTFGLQKFNHASSRTKSKIIHNIVIASERGFNHKIERLHNTIRERTKIMRGFHGSLECARAIMKGFEIFYNFVRKHQEIKKKPYEMALPELKFSNNVWLDLIKLSEKINT